MARGIFISLEGSEACGKSTQIRRLRERLEAAGRAVLQVREPGSTAIGEEIRHLLQFSKAGDAMTPETELLLFTASRAQLVREAIRPALDAGTVVLADRFLDSTTVYQGVARCIDAAEVVAVNHFAVGECVPDITFVLDLDPAVAAERMTARPSAGDDRMERQPAEFYRAVRAGYLALAAAEPERVRLVDAAPDEAVVEASIKEILEGRFDGIFRS